MARTDLPSVSTPIAQKTVEYDEKVYCLIKEKDQYTLSVTENPALGNWNKEKVNFTFVPEME